MLRLLTIPKRLFSESLRNQHQGHCLESKYILDNYLQFVLEVPILFLMFFRRVRLLKPGNIPFD